MAIDLKVLFRGNNILFHKQWLCIALLCIGMWLIISSFRISYSNIFNNPHWPLSLPFPDHLIITIYKLLVPLSQQIDLAHVASLPRKSQFSQWDYDYKIGNDFKIIRYIMLLIGTIMIFSGVSIFRPGKIGEEKGEKTKGDITDY